MKQVIEYLVRPETIWKVIVGIFALGMLRSNLNSRIATTTVRIDKLELLDLGTKLSRIETDISWIKSNLATDQK